MKKGNTKYNEKIIEILLKNIPSEENQGCKQFFSFLCQIFDETFAQNKQNL